MEAVQVKSSNAENVIVVPNNCGVHKKEAE